MSLTVLRLTGRRAARLVVGAALAGAGSCANPDVIPTAPEIRISPPSATITVGDSATFAATARPSAAFRWTSSAPSVAVVSAAGVVRGLAPGRAIITVAVVPERGLATAAAVDVLAR